MSKFVSFVVKHDKAILNSVSALFFISMMVVAVVDMDNMLAVMALLVGYVVVAGVFLFIAGSDVRQDHRNRVAQNLAASQRNRKPV